MRINCQPNKGGCGQRWPLEQIEGYFRKHHNEGTDMPCLNTSCSRKIPVVEITKVLTALEAGRAKSNPQLPSPAEIAKVQHYLHQHLDDGISCPGCGQFAKRYRRKLNSGMARSLCWLATQPVEFIDVQQDAPEFVLKSAEINKLSWWGLVEAPAGATRRSNGGIWRITDEGLKFANGETELPRYAFVYNNKCERLGGDPIDVRGALGNHFNYEELMSGSSTPG